ncbi:MAG: ATP-binding protein [Candidatus Eisenbacteria sp.]|nr:ATP-binding protein [Candidatus Eisenbacteria bacterium]
MKVDLSGGIIRRIRRVIDLAERASERGDLRRGAAHYREAAALYERMARYCISPAGRKDQRVRAMFLRERAANLIEQQAHASAAQGKAASGSSVTHASPGAPSGGPGETAARAEGVPPDPLDNAALREHVRSFVRRTTVDWGDIGGLEETKRRVQTALSLTLARPPRGVRVPRSRTLLLEGPPGTGKTLLAAAVAGHLGATFFDVKASQLLSRYFGDSPRLVSLLFAEARAQAPAVIFLDEFDALAATRSGVGTGPEHRILATLLAELDGVASKESSAPVLTMAATNAPQLLDPAILSRFAARIAVPLPDAPAREQILRIHVAGAGFSTDVPYGELVSRSAGFSGRDISQLCSLAVETMLVRANPSLLELHAVGVHPAQGGLLDQELTVVSLSREDFEKAFELVGLPALAGSLSRGSSTASEVGGIES